MLPLYAAVLRVGDGEGNLMPAQSGTLDRGRDLRRNRRAAVSTVEMCSCSCGEGWQAAMGEGSRTTGRHPRERKGASRAGPACPRDPSCVGRAQQVRAQSGAVSLLRRRPTRLTKSSVLCGSLTTNDTTNGGPSPSGAGQGLALDDDHRHSRMSLRRPALHLVGYVGHHCHLFRVHHEGVVMVAS